MNRWPLSDTERARRRERDLYAGHFSTETVERQAELAKALWPCCGEHRDGPHHQACAKYVEPETTVDPNQGALL